MLEEIEILIKNFSKLFEYDEEELKEILLSFEKRGLLSERLELLGDKVISLTIVKWMLLSFPKSDEGEISKKLNYLSSKEVMGDIVSRQKLYLRKINLKRKADLLEVLIGFLYVKGAPYLEEKIKKLFQPYLNIYNENTFNPKGQLQEILAKRGLNPIYKSKKRESVFEAECIFTYLGIKRSFYGWSSTIKSAESLAAREALYFLKRSVGIESKWKPFKVIVSPLWYVNLIKERVSGIRFIIREESPIFPILIKLSPSQRKIIFLSRTLIDRISFGEI